MQAKNIQFHRGNNTKIIHINFHKLRRVGVIRHINTSCTFLVKALRIISIIVTATLNYIDFRPFASIVSLFCHCSSHY